MVATWSSPQRSAAMPPHPHSPCGTELHQHTSAAAQGAHAFQAHRTAKRQKSRNCASPTSGRQAGLLFSLLTQLKKLKREWNKPKVTGGKQKNNKRETKT